MQRLLCVCVLVLAGCRHGPTRDITFAVRSCSVWRGVTKTENVEKIMGCKPDFAWTTADGTHYQRWIYFTSMRPTQLSYSPMHGRWLAGPDTSAARYLIVVSGPDGVVNDVKDVNPVTGKDLRDEPRKETESGK